MAGVAPRVAQAAMRHSDLKLTMNTYTDARLVDTASAVESLPNLPLAPHAPNMHQMLTTVFKICRFLTIQATRRKVAENENTLQNANEMQGFP